jgi:hypothetical protein
MRRTFILISLCALGLSVSTCTDHSAAAKAVSHSASATAPDTARYSIAHQLAAFRAGLPAVHRIEGFSSRDALVRSFAAAVRRNDRAALQRMTIDRAEFAYLYYPESPLSKKPYELDPDLMWMQVTARSDRGLFRLLQSYSGHFAYRGYTCADTPKHLGAITLHDGCRVRHTLDRKDAEERLFGSIIEVGGRYKFVGFSNKL